MGRVEGPGDGNCVRAWRRRGRRGRRWEGEGWRGQGRGGIGTGTIGDVVCAARASAERRRGVRDKRASGRLGGRASWGFGCHWPGLRLLVFSPVPRRPAVWTQLRYRHWGFVSSFFPLFYFLLAPTSLHAHISLPSSLLLPVSLSILYLRSSTTRDAHHGPAPAAVPAHAP